MSDLFLITRYDVIVYVISLQETCQSIMFLQVHHLNSNCRKNVSYSSHSWKSMDTCVKCRFSLNLQLFSVVLKSVSVKYTATYCPWDSHQIHSSCPSMSLWWESNPSLWLSWGVSIPKWVLIVWHAACTQSDAKLLEGGVITCPYKCGMELLSNMASFKVWEWISKFISYVMMNVITNPCRH